MHHFGKETMMLLSIWDTHDGCPWRLSWSTEHQEVRLVLSSVGQLRTIPSQTGDRARHLKETMVSDEQNWQNMIEGVSIPKDETESVHPWGHWQQGSIEQQTWPGQCRQRHASGIEPRAPTVLFPLTKQSRPCAEPGAFSHLDLLPLNSPFIQLTLIKAHHVILSICVRLEG